MNEQLVLPGIADDRLVCRRCGRPLRRGDVIRFRAAVCSRKCKTASWRAHPTTRKELRT